MEQNGILAQALVARVFWLLSHKLTARERIHFLLDEGSFEEIGMLVTHRSTNFGLGKLAQANSPAREQDGIL